MGKGEGEGRGEVDIRAHLPVVQRVHEGHPHHLPPRLLRLHHRLSLVAAVLVRRLARDPLSLRLSSSVNAPSLPSYKERS